MSSWRRLGSRRVGSSNTLVLKTNTNTITNMAEYQGIQSITLRASWVEKGIGVGLGLAKRCRLGLGIRCCRYTCKRSIKHFLGPCLSLSKMLIWGGCNGSIKHFLQLGQILICLQQVHETFLGPVSSVSWVLHVSRSSVLGLGEIPG